MSHIVPCGWLAGYGIVPLQARGGLVTNDLVNRHREQEGIWLVSLDRRIALNAVAHIKFDCAATLAPMTQAVG